MNLIEFVKRYDSAMRCQRAGQNQNYGRATREHKKRHYEKEPKKSYKALDTYKDVVISKKDFKTKRSSMNKSMHKVKINKKYEHNTTINRVGFEVSKQTVKPTQNLTVTTISGRVSKRPVRSDFVR